jgi:hypothetical protein
MMNFKRLGFGAVVFLISTFQQINAQEFSIEKPFVSFDEAKNLCDCLYQIPKNRLPLTVNLTNLNLSAITDIFNKAQLIKPKCLDENNNNLLDYNEKSNFKKLFSKLKNSEVGINCNTVAYISRRVVMTNQLCSPHYPTSFSTFQHSDYPGQDVTAGNMSVKGAYGQGDIFVDQGGTGFIEYRNLALEETPGVGGAGAGIWSYPQAQQSFVILADNFDKFVSVTSFTQNAPIPLIIAWSAWGFKKCGTPNIDPGQLAKAYCELKNLNGILYSEPTLKNQSVATHTGPSNTCVN